MISPSLVRVFEQAGCPAFTIQSNGWSGIRQALQETSLTAPNSAATILASLLYELWCGEGFAQRRLPTRAELLGDLGVRHEEVKSMKGTTHDQEFGCDSGMDEPPRILHVFFGEQVDRTNAEPGRR